MATQNESAETLIAGAFAVLTDRPLAGAGGGLAAFAATDRRSGRGGLMAVQTRREAPARAQVMSRLSSGDVDGVVAPVAHGPAPGADGAPAWFVICEAPPGGPLWPAGATSGPVWREAELLDRVLRPAAAALERLAARHVTHRAIRPDNLFRAGPGENVVLGCAWAGPPAGMQPAIFEPPTSAACLPQGRGDGGIADDVYALGVTLLCLAIGRVPLAGLDERAVLRRKLELGSYAALAGEERLPPIIGDIVRGMLAEDPEHRPAPALLADTAAARNRRVAARPVTRAQAPLEVEGGPVWNVRMLAHAFSVAPEAAVRLLRNGSIDRWLRRSLGDSPMAMRLEELRRQRAIGQSGEDPRADATLAMSAAALLDPLAPLAWQGMPFWPDGLGPLLADPQIFASRGEALFDLIDSEAIAVWGLLRAERSDQMVLRQDAHRLRGLLRQRGWGGGLARLLYSLNPLLACESAVVQNRQVVRLADVLPALEAAAPRADPAGLPLDADFAAFLAARHEARMDSEIALLAGDPPERAAVAQLRLLGMMQRRSGPVALPALAGWLRRHAEPALSVWRNAQRRSAMVAALDEMSRAGALHGMLALLEDSDALTADAQEATLAAAQVAAINGRLGQLGGGTGMRAAAARQAGHDTVLGLAMCGLAISAVAAVLG